MKEGATRGSMLAHFEKAKSFNPFARHESYMTLFLFPTFNKTSIWHCQLLLEFASSSLWDSLFTSLTQSYDLHWTLFVKRD